MPNDQQWLLVERNWVKLNRINFHNASKIDANETSIDQFHSLGQLIQFYYVWVELNNLKDFRAEEKYEGNLKEDIFWWYHGIAQPPRGINELFPSHSSAGLWMGMSRRAGHELLNSLEVDEAFRQGFEFSHRVRNEKLMSSRQVDEEFVIRMRQWLGNFVVRRS